MKVVDLIETEPTWAALEAKAEAARGDYRVITWRDHVPEEYVDDYCALGEAFFDEAPIGEMEIEPERWDRKRVRGAGGPQPAHRAARAVGRRDQPRRHGWSPSPS